MKDLISLLFALPVAITGTRCGIKASTAHLPNGGTVVPMAGSNSWLCDGDWAFKTYKVSTLFL